VSNRPFFRLSRRSLKPSAALLLATTTLAACSPFVATRGNLVDGDHLAQVREGQSREEVQKVLGTPSVVSEFNENVWYYVGRRTQQTAFFTPDVVEQRIVKVSFNDAGTVSQVQQVEGMDVNRAVTPVGRETPTAGRELSFLQQFLGNLTRPPKKKKDKKDEE
jgi:outer membrane protein assembly factor BamE (lipoprotein component of BamABCDE complex)